MYIYYQIYMWLWYLHIDKITVYIYISVIIYITIISYIFTVFQYISTKYPLSWAPVISLYPPPLEGPILQRGAPWFPTAPGDAPRGAAAAAQPGATGGAAGRPETSLGSLGRGLRQSWWNFGGFLWDFLMGFLWDFMVLDVDCFISGRDFWMGLNH